jgi:hypothetical protein
MGVLNEYELKLHSTYLDCVMSHLVQNVDCHRKNLHLMRVQEGRPLAAGEIEKGRRICHNF